MRQLLTLLLMIWTPFLFGKVPFFERAPTWVRAVETPIESAQDQESRYLLLNKQICAATEEEFQQVVIQLSNQSSVEEHSQIAISFDPAYETLKLHELALYREGKKIDKRWTSRIQVLQRELGLESNLLNGKHSLTIVMDDVRVGDILSYSFTAQGKQPAFGNHFFLTHYFNYNLPIERNYLRLLLPKDAMIYEKIHQKDALQQNQPIQKEGNEWVFDVQHLDAATFETDTPIWYNTHPYLELTDFASWEDVAALFAPYYATQSDLSLQRLASELTQNCQTQEEKALALLDFVQNEIRYFGIELDVNAFHPELPAQVLKQRHGDCKDKTLLLRTLLHEVGILSSPILVNSYLQEKVLDKLPNPTAFNHVILCVHLQGKDYFVDPTFTYQGGSLSNRYLPNYSFGLSLNSEGFVTIPSYNLPSKSIDIQTDYVMLNRQKLQVQSTNIYRGVEADSFRTLFKTEGLDYLKEYFRDYYSKTHGKVTEIDLQFNDNPETNECILTENCSIERHQEDEPFYVAPSTLDAYMFQNIDPERRIPLALNHPKNIREKITLTTPTRFQVPTNRQSKQHPWCDISYSTEVRGNTFTVECAYESKRDHILPEELSSFRSHLISLRNEIPYEFTLPEIKTPTVGPQSLYPKAGYIFLTLGLALLLAGIMMIYKKPKSERQQWKQKLSLMKKR